MDIINLDHFVLTVNDLTKSKNFYTDVINLPVIAEQTNENFVSLKCGNSLLRLRKVHNDSHAIVAQHLVTGTFDFCLQNSDSIAAIINNFNQHHIPIELGPVTKHGAHGEMTSVYVRDPDHNLVEICSYE